MTKKNKFTLLAIMALVWASTKGQEAQLTSADNVNVITSRIESSNSKIQSLQSDFIQEKELSFLEEKVFSSGKFYFQRENKIRWEYSKPYSYVIVMNGSLIRIEDEGKTNTLDASSNRLFSSISHILAGIIDGSVIQQEEQFKAKFLENERMVKVLLEPRMSGFKEFIQRIELDINKKDYNVDAVKLVEKNGDYTLINFTNKKFNAPLQEDIFSVN
jgi:outer membrane lipoprotein-sorting protein